MSGDVVGHPGEVDRGERWGITGGGATLWLTGLSGSGKSTVAHRVEAHLVATGRPAYVLDGDNLRLGLNGDLGFTAPDRHENVRRTAEVARLMADAGLVVLVPLISPYREGRRRARLVHDEHGLPFREIHVATPLAVCEARDPKGMYARARAGEIQGFTGVDDPYEPPTEPDLVVDTATLTVEQATERVLALVPPRYPDGS